MDHNQTYEEHSKSIILNDSDNIIIALDNMKAGQYLKNFDVIIDSPILSGQKIARVNISKDSPIYKYGTIIAVSYTHLTLPTKA